MESELKLNENQISDYREAFSFFDKDADGFIKTTELGRLLRSVNLAPTEAEITHY